MRARQPLLLLHPIFILTISLLLLNDFYLKQELHSWLTGKLSDITGLFAFTVFLFVFFPDHKKWVILFTCLFFLWWKSPFIEPVLFFMNRYLNLPVHRTVDYSDYLALTVIPTAYYIKPVLYSRSMVRTTATWMVGIISFFSFTATSMIRRLADSNRVKMDKYVHTMKTEHAVVDSLRKAGLNPQRISAIYERDWGRRLYVKAKDKFGDTVLTSLNEIYPEIYLKIDYGSVYNIPVMYLKGDSIFNLQFIISGEYGRSREIWFHSFEYRRPRAIGVTGEPYNPLEFDSYQVSKKFGKPVKKRIREIIRGSH